MTDYDLRPKTHWGAVVTVAIAVAGAVWGGTEYLHSRADEGEVKEMRKDAFQTRLDMETIKGDVKAINIRLDESFKSIGQKLDANNEPKRRR